MTAINMIVQSDACHLITDGAYYDAGGRVMELRTKVTTCSRVRMAIGCSGSVKDIHVVQRLGQVTDQTDAITRLPGIFGSIRDANRADHPEGETTQHNELMLFVAIWSDRTDRAEGWVIASDQAYLGDAYQPGTLVEVEQLTSPPLPVIDAVAFDASRDGAALLDAQRRYRWPDNRRVYVGGFGEATTVTREGVTKRRLCEWPDKVGEHIAA